jgi:hypothetical protein
MGAGFENKCALVNTRAKIDGGLHHALHLGYSGGRSPGELIHFSSCDAVLTRFLQEGIAFGAAWKRYGLLVELTSPRQEPILKRYILFGTPPPLGQGALLSVRGWRERDRSLGHRYMPGAGR